MKDSLKTYFFLSIALLAVSCSNGSDEDKKEALKKETIPYFMFDKVEHYSIRISELDAMDIITEEHPAGTKLGKMNYLLEGDGPETLADTSFLLDIEEIGFSKHILSKKYFDGINDIFSVKEHEEGYAYSCIPIFRDILVFRLAGKIQGIAKICFSCDQKRIVGTDKDFQYFGMSGDYQKLHKLLHENATAD